MTKDNQGCKGAYNAMQSEVRNEMAETKCISCGRGLENSIAYQRKEGEYFCQRCRNLLGEEIKHPGRKGHKVRRRSV